MVNNAFSTQIFPEFPAKSCVKDSGETGSETHNARPKMGQLTSMVYICCSLQEPLRHLRTPDSQTLIPSVHPPDRRILIHQIAIRIMLDHKARGIPPASPRNQQHEPSSPPHKQAQPQPPTQKEGRVKKKLTNNQKSDSQEYASRRPTRSCTPCSAATGGPTAACRNRAPRNSHGAHASSGSSP